MNITYAESKGKLTFNWFEELSQLNISDERWEKLKKLSHSWITCACGNQCDIIPRNEFGQPVDEKLANLGGNKGFFGAIRNKEAEIALKYLHQIEARSAELIQIEVDKAREIIAITETIKPEDIKTLGAYFVYFEEKLKHAEYIVENYKKY